MNIDPYLFFDGCCEEAIDFYRRALGAEVEMMMRNSESPDLKDPSMVPPGSENKILHATLRIDGNRINVSDGKDSGKPKFEGFSLSITASDEAEAEKLFAALSDGGQVQVPLIKTFFTPKFGMLADRFGVPWMIYVVLKA
jgi:PhnB protein